MLPCTACVFVALRYYNLDYDIFNSVENVSSFFSSLSSIGNMLCVQLSRLPLL